MGIKVVKRVVKRKAKLTPTQRAVMGAPRTPNPDTKVRKKRQKTRSNSYKQGLQNLRHGVKGPA